MNKYTYKTRPRCVIELEPTLQNNKTIEFGMKGMKKDGLVVSAFIPIKLHLESQGVYSFTKEEESKCIIRKKTHQQEHKELVVLHSSEESTPVHHLCPCDMFMEYCRSLIEKQSFILPADLSIGTPVMRCQFVAWLFNICDYLNYSKKVAFLALSVVDSYTSRINVSSDTLGLIFLTSLFSAAKFESYRIRANDLLAYIGNRYSKEDVLNMEVKIMKSMNYKLDIPTAYDFLMVLFEASNYKQNNAVINSSITFLQMMAFDPKFTSMSPSSLAASAFYLARDFCHYADLWNCKYQKCLLMKKDEVKDSSKNFIPKMEDCLRNTVCTCSFKYVQQFFTMIKSHCCKKSVNQSQHTKKNCYWDSSNAHLD